MPTLAEIAGWRQRHQQDGHEMSDWLLAVVYLIVKEINILRNLHGLSPRTTDQVVTAIKSAMDDLTVDP